MGYIHSTTSLYDTTKTVTGVENATITDRHEAPPNTLEIIVNTNYNHVDGGGHPGYEKFL